MPKTKYFSDEWGTSGIDITYTKSRKEFSVSGWYDTFVGIEPKEISLGDFLRYFGITEKDCQKALRD